MDTTSTPIYAFNGFRLEVATERLAGPDGELLPLHSRAFATLRYLVERPGQVVTKAELMDAVWPRTVVSENNLNQCILQLRKLLGESASHPRFILTVPGSGFKFVAPVTVLANGDLARAGMATQEAALATGRDGARTQAIAAIVAALLLVAAAAWWLARTRPVPVTNPAEYQALTDVADSATAPVLSPDGRTLAFLRNGEWLLGTGQVWARTLPDGQYRQLTQAPGLVFAPAFSPDGARVAYTMVDARGESWDTWTVPTAGGEPTRLLPNASGLTWTGPGEVMYSEFRSGIHLGIVGSHEDRSAHRDLYWPAHQRAMAHFSAWSPARRALLVVEMDGTGRFGPCRLVPVPGDGVGTPVGPAKGSCTGAAWSVDGQWMYFSARVDGHSHLWRQRSAASAPEQITFGPGDEQTVFAAPDGHSLLTSIGTGQNTLWLHDAGIERALTTEGSVGSPWLSADGRRAYFLSRGGSGDGLALERLEVASGHREVLLPASGIAGFDISTDERELAWCVLERGVPEVWVAPLDRHAAPVRLVRGGDQPQFGGPWLYFRRIGAQANYLHRIGLDGGHEERVIAWPIVNFDGVAPDGRVAAVARPDAGGLAASWLVSLADHVEWKVGRGWFPLRWSPDGRRLYVEVGTEADATQPGRTAIVPLGANGLPMQPIVPLARGTEVMARPADGLAVANDPAYYVYVKSEQRRNIYRIPLH